MDLNQLVVGVIDSPNHPDFDMVYDCYSRVFTLPTERESKENFLDILKRNADPEVQVSKAKEMWIYLKDPKTGRVVGASNIDVFAGSAGRGIDGTLQGIYTFVDPEFRKNGVFTKLVAEREKAAADFCRHHFPKVISPKVITFVEQNSPLLMTAEEYLKDNAAAGIDQCARRTVFEKAGFRTAGFRYIQPDLEKVGGAGKCEYLDIQIKAPGSSVPAEAVGGHLDRFFKLSFPQGTNINNHGLEEMARSLQHKGDIRLQTMGRFNLLSRVVNEKSLSALSEVEKVLPLHSVALKESPFLANALKDMPGVVGKVAQAASHIR